MASNPARVLFQYRVHLLVFLLACIAALTAAHPAFLVTDEWITGNQLAQLNEGHQAIISEGKYGMFENGTSYPYFTARNNYLGYSLLFPLVSLPAEWIVYLFGNQFTFFITYLWTFLLIGLALVLNAFFPAYTCFRKLRWTTGLIVLSFVGFFSNLFYYTSFDLTGKNSSPEILAIVFTNVLLFALLAVIVYEILQIIFRDTTFAFFGTVVCLSCSSYFFWTTFCKDHVLVALLFSLILLTVITFLATGNLPSLFGSFFFAGLLIWARPELGVFIFFALCCLLLAVMVWGKNRTFSSLCHFRIFLSPLFTLLGAVPFLINNYLASKNFLIPSFVLAMNISSTSVGVTGSTSASQPYLLDTIHTLLQANELTALTYLSSFPADVMRVLFLPQSGSMGVLVIVPVFLTAILIVPLLRKMNTRLFDEKEKMIIGTLFLLSLAIFCAYIHRAYGLNIDLGIMPDIRYLSPVYLPLTIIGLMLFKKAPGILDMPLEILAGIVAAWMVCIPLTLALILLYYPEPMEWKNIFPLLSLGATIGIFFVSLGVVLMYYYSVLGNRPAVSVNLTKKIFAVMCALPLIWQVDASFLACLFSNGLGGYLFWLPVLLKLLNVVI